jgi:hypothetical protein
MSLLTCRNGAPSHPAVWSFDQSLKSDNILFTSLETLDMATTSTQAGTAGAKQERAGESELGE